MVLPRRSMHSDRPDQSQRVDSDVPLAAGDLFPGIIAAFFPAFGGADRLTIDDRDAGRRFFAALLTNSSAQHLMNALPDASLTPAPKGRVHGRPFGKIMWQCSPLATRSIDIQDRVEHPPPTNRFATSLRWLRQQSANYLPLSVRQIAGIMSAHRYGSVFLDFVNQEAES